MGFGKEDGEWKLIEKDIAERAKEEKVSYCQLMKQKGMEGFEIKLEDNLKQAGCGFYQRMPCENQGELLYLSRLTPIYECKKEQSRG